MFDEIEDEDMAMIDSITEEEEDSDDRPAGFTLSEVSAPNIPELSYNSFSRLFLKQVML